MHSLYLENLSKLKYYENKQQRCFVPRRLE